MGEKSYITEAAPGRTVLLEGVEYLFFSGTAYLGMHRNAALTELLNDGLEKYGPAYGSSRASNLQLAVYREAEERLAAWLGSEACTLMSSGYMAGQLVSHYLRKEGWTLHYAPGSHPALLGAAEAAPDISWEAWLAQLLPELAAARGKQAILTNSLDPLHSERHDFSFAARLPRGKERLLIIDDSHGFGVLGNDGEGIVSCLPHPVQAELMILGSLGKGMGIPAGAVWSTARRARQLRDLAFFISASPPAPAGLHAFLQAGELYGRAIEKLKMNTTYFSHLVKELKQVRHAPELPVFFLEDEGAAAHLLKQCIFISSFPYPEVHSKPLSRIILSSLHTTADLERLAAALKDYFPD